MKIAVSERVARDYGGSIRKIAPRAKLVVPSIREGEVVWSGDPATAEVCCFSEDLWQDVEQRAKVLPEFFRLTGLKWFHTFSAGVDSPVFQQIIDRGAILTNSSGASAPSIAQYVLAMMLYRAKRIEDWRGQQAGHLWQQIFPQELTGQTVGIIGTGSIGGEVGRLARAFNMRVLGVRRSGKPARYVDEMLPMRSLRRLLCESDFVVVACPLTKETEGLIGEGELRAMKPTATLINIARGRVVDEPALIAALQEGVIAGAVLDVFAREPLPPDSPLWDMLNVIVTPHNSGFSPLNNSRGMAIFLDNLERYVSGRKLRNRVLQAGA